VGGPIQKDKTFFFGNYEGLRTNQSSTILANVPSPDARNGILHNSDGSTCTIGIYRAPGTLSSTDPGCNLQNSKGTVGVDPLVIPYLALYGLPNSGLYPGQNTGIYTFAGKSVTNENFYTGRIDKKFAQNDSFFASGEYDHSTLTLPDAMNDISNLSYTTRGLLALEETHIVSPRLGNTFRAGYSRSFAESAPPTAINLAAGDASLGPATGTGTPTLDVGGLSLASGAHGSELYIYPYNSSQYYDDAHLTKGKHDLRFGAVAERDQMNAFFTSGLAGTFNFASLSNFLLNVPQSIRDAVPSSISPRYWRQTIPAAYVQDNIRWFRNLTINLRLRYEMATVVTEKYNKIASLHNPTDLAPTLGAPFYSNPTYRNFAPRVGFAWDPFKDGKTSIRAGFGIFDILPLLSEITYKDTQSAPYNEQGNGTNLPQGSFPVTAFSLSRVNSLLRTFYLQQKPKRDYAMTWNLNLEQELTSSLSGMVAYVGSHGVHEPFAVDDMNIVLPTKTAIGYLWPYPVGGGQPLNSAPGTAVGRIDHLEWTNSTRFDALEALISKRMGHGIQVQGSYTWSKAIDEGDGINIGDPFANSISSLFFFDPKLRRGLADYNLAHNLTVHYICS
jgi:TonB dependent receptor